jgi:6,7-dimethyl-8-ribityllumazine synthase
MAEAPSVAIDDGEPAGLRILIVEARFYEDIADALLAGATGVLEQAGANWDRVTVPGSLEVPAAVAMALDAAESRGLPYDGVVALGCVIRGDTLHFEIVATQSARALMDLAVARRLPLGNGILTVEDEAQARARAGGEHGNKGSDAAQAALTMVQLKRELDE